jgi:hypothetical protein
MKKDLSMEVTSELTHPTNVVTRIAVEDIQPGDFITVYSEIIELPSYLWCCDTATNLKDELVRLRYLPRDAGEPYKVIATCLPFVYAKRTNGKPTSLDTRRHQLVRLDRAIGKKMWRSMKGKS